MTAEDAKQAEIDRLLAENARLLAEIAKLERELDLMETAGLHAPKRNRRFDDED